MNCLLFNNTSCSLKLTSTIVLFYKRLKGLSFRSHNAKFCVLPGSKLPKTGFLMTRLIYLSGLPFVQLLSN